MGQCFLKLTKTRFSKETLLYQLMKDLFVSMS
jgi:hypothetical protein